MVLDFNLVHHLETQDFAITEKHGIHESRWSPELVPSVPLLHSMSSLSINITSACLQWNLVYQMHQARWLPVSRNISS